MVNNADYILIYNPNAAAGKNNAVFNEILKRLDKFGLKYRPIHTEYPGHAVKLAEDYAKDGYSIIGVGGDGTCNEVLNGVMISGKKVPLGFIPMGSGNDIPGALGYAPDPLRACEILKENNMKKFDVGIAEHPDLRLNEENLQKKRYFLGIGSQGFDAEVTKVTNSETKSLQGTFNYVKNVIKLVFKFKIRPIKLVIDGKTVFEGFCNLVAVGNGPSYGGGMYICPYAKPDDGIFNITIVRMGSLKLLYNFNKMYSKTLHPHPSVLEFIGKKISIEMLPINGDPGQYPFDDYDRKFLRKLKKGSPENGLEPEFEPYITQVDGEIMDFLPVNYSFLDGGFEFIAPSKNEMEMYFEKKYGKKYEQHLKKHGFDRDVLLTPPYAQRG